jgi:hypothetical protein
MGNRFASAKNSIAQCDRCGFRFKLTELRKEIWYITGGNGKKWRAEIETKEGWVNFQGVRQ